MWCSVVYCIAVISHEFALLRSMRSVAFHLHYQRYQIFLLPHSSNYYYYYKFFKRCLLPYESLSFISHAIHPISYYYHLLSHSSHTLPPPSTPLPPPPHSSPRPLTPPPPTPPYPCSTGYDDDSSSRKESA